MSSVEFPICWLLVDRVSLKYIYTHMILKFCLLQSISQSEEPYQSLLHISCSIFTLLLSALSSSKPFPQCFLFQLASHMPFPLESINFIVPHFSSLLGFSLDVTSNKSFIMSQSRLDSFSRHSHNTHNCIVYYNCLFICLYFSLGYKFSRSGNVD